MEMTLYELRAAPRPGPKPGPKPAANPAPRSGPATGHILLVDDDPDFRGMLAIAFARAGFTVHEAENGNVALALLAEQPIDLIVTDIIMPEADGYEVILRLKALPARPPLIAVSGGCVRLKLELPRMARLLGADAAFEKPLIPEALLSEARRLIGERRAETEIRRIGLPAAL